MFAYCMLCVNSTNLSFCTWKQSIIIILCANTYYLLKQASYWPGDRTYKQTHFWWFGLSLIFNNSFFSLIHIHMLNLASWFYFLHLSPTNQTSNNTKNCWLEGDFTQINKSFQAKGREVPISLTNYFHLLCLLQQNILSLPNCPGKPWNISFSFPGVEEVWSPSKKKKFSNNSKLGKPRQISPCHSCQAHKEKKLYHPTWLGEFNPKHC